MKIEDLKNKAFLGDCLEIMRDIPDQSIDMILADLPYGTTQNKWDSVIDLDQLWPLYERIIKDTGMILLFAGEPFTSKLICSNLKNFKYRITWDRSAGSGHLNSAKRPLTQVEDICIFSKVKLGQGTYNPQLTEKPKKNIRPKGNGKTIKQSVYGKSYRTNSVNYDKTKSFPTDLVSISARAAECNPTRRKHPTQKPLTLIEYLIKTYSEENDIILDNTAGSGTTGVGCINTNRDYILIEKEQEYFDIINDRLLDAIL